MDLSTVKHAIVRAVKEEQGRLFSIAENLFENPEVGLKEINAAALLSGELEREGFRVERGLAGMESAFGAYFGEGSVSIAIIAEMDALPVMGHACGHNVIAAAAIGAAVAIRRVLPSNSVRITVLGTPAEEQGIGKIEMVRAGCFDDIDFAMMVHPSSKRQVVKMYLGLSKVRFTFYGKAAHAAAHPEEGVNALDAVIQMFNAVGALRQQLRQDVKVHGIITEGGVAPNIIPEKAACFFYIRAQDLGEVEAVKKRVIACAEGAALASGCSLDVVEDERVLAPLKLNWSFYELYSRQLEYLGLPEAKAAPDRNMGSSDIGNVSHVVPTIHPHVPIGTGIHIHTDAFAQATISDRGKQAVVEGATAMALTAVELVASHALREKIMKEFSDSLGK